MKAVEACLLDLPWRGGVSKTHLGSIINSVQAWAVLWYTALAMVLARASPQRALARLGTCLKSRTRVVQISSRDGRASVAGVSERLGLAAALYAGAHYLQELRLWAIM